MDLPKLNTFVTIRTFGTYLKRDNAIKKIRGSARFRSRYLAHAKRALEIEKHRASFVSFGTSYLYGSRATRSKPANSRSTIEMTHLYQLSYKPHRVVRLHVRRRAVDFEATSPSSVVCVYLRALLYSFLTRTGAVNRRQHLF